MTATAERQEKSAPELHGSPRERLQRGRVLKRIMVQTSLGPFWLRELRWAEKEEADFGVVQNEGDGKGNVTQHFDSRGHRGRQLALALINEDGSQVYPGPLIAEDGGPGEGVKEIGMLPRDVVEALGKGFDEVNPVSPEAKEEMGKNRGPATK